MTRLTLADRIARGGVNYGATPMKYGLTPEQKRALDYISGYILEHGYSPSYDEIMSALNLRSKSGVSRLVFGLKDRGYITLIEGKSRSVSLV